MKNEKQIMSVTINITNKKSYLNQDFVYFIPNFWKIFMWEEEEHNFFYTHI